MKDILDLHTHTIASGHAYSTIVEMAGAAEEKGLQLLGITEHGPRMNGSCAEMYFHNLKVAPRKRGKLQMLFGAELNILDTEGGVDLPTEVIKGLDLTVASLHMPTFTPGNRQENTKAYLNVMKNPWINIIGHPDDFRYPVDYQALVEGAKETNTILEINNASLSPKSFRGDCREAYLEMLDYCRQYKVPVVMDSDAHVDVDAGNHRYAMALLEEADFPEELVLNTDLEKIKQYLNIYIRDK